MDQVKSNLQESPFPFLGKRQTLASVSESESESKLSEVFLPHINIFDCLHNISTQIGSTTHLIDSIEEFMRQIAANNIVYNSAEQPDAPLPPLTSTQINLLDLANLNNDRIRALNNRLAYINDFLQKVLRPH